MLRTVLKTTAVVLVGLAAFVALIVVWNLALLGISRLFGLNPEYVKYASWVLLAAVFWLPKRYFRIKREITFTGETEINAPIDVVWNAVDLREGPSQYKKAFSEFRAVPGTDDMFEMHFAPMPDDPGPHPDPIVVQRVAASAPNYLAVHHANTEDSGNLGIGASAEETFLTETDTGTHVRITETLSHVSFWLLITLFFVSPIKDTLKSLKHHCEGEEDTSWAAKSMNPNLSGGAQSSVVTAGVTACVVLTAAMFGIVYLVLGLAP